MKNFQAMCVSIVVALCGTSAVFETCAQEEASRADAAGGFRRTRVIGYSQVGSPGGGWFVDGGVFESVVDDQRWELLWAGGAGVDRWRDPRYTGWSQRLVSPCPGDDPPDRVLLSISGPYGDDEQAWAEAITDTIRAIRQNIPSARQIILQPVVGGPQGKTCSPPGRVGRVRASWQHAHIVNAIAEVVRRQQDTEVEVRAGYAPQVRTCADYRDGLGHLTSEAAQAVARSIGEFYARWDRRP